MSYPKTQAEFENYAGTWTDTELDLDGFPENIKFIVGREDKIGIGKHCVLCKQISFFSWKDQEILKKAVPICSKCYLSKVKK